VEQRQDLAAALDWALAERRPALLDIVVDEGDKGTAA
jgi:thiamine pyrophosphate-dependent acetolactate synthase large subunit-like protein